MKSKILINKIDKPLLIMSVLYSCIGILFILSASSITAVLEYELSPYHYFFRQFLFVLIGYFIGFFIILRTPTKMYKKFIYLIILGLTILLIGLIVYGEITNGVKSWFPIGTFSFQPSEFAKLAIIIYLGIFFGEYDKRKSGKYSFLVPMIFAGIIFTLVLMQPDLGTAVIIAGITFFIFLALPIEKNKVINIFKYIAMSLAVLGTILILTGTLPLTKEQLSRLNYKEPCTRYTEKTGYQVCNGFIAISNGGILGQGLGKSTQKYLYLPAAYTDMIFPIIVEELGIIFGILLILGFIFILYRILKIAKSCFKLRNSIICYGVMIFILLHILLNFCGVLALIPLTGVPVPFFSYGGCFTWNIIFAIFIVERINIENELTKKEIEIKSI